MFAVGHLSLGYLVSKAVQKATKTDVNLPVVFFLSLIPDIDLLFRRLTPHRGPTHSLVVQTLVFVPVFLYYRRRSLPYFAALASHALIGDLLTADGAQILWPLTRSWYGFGIGILSVESISIELLVFVLAMAALVMTKDIRRLWSGQRSNLILTIPSGVILLSGLAGYGEAYSEAMFLPHMIFLAIFSISILRGLSTEKK